MDFKLPKLGEGADSGVVVNLFVKEGEDIGRKKTGLLQTLSSLVKVIQVGYHHFLVLIGNVQQ